MKRIGIAISSFNRPELLEAVLEAMGLGGCADYDLWIFQDGPRNASDEPAVDACCKIAEAYAHPNKHLIVSPQNIGCGLTFLKAWTTLMDDESYDGMFFLEDDQLVVPNFFMYGAALQMRAEAESPLAMTQQFSALCAGTTKEQQAEILSLSTWQILRTTKRINFQGFYLSRSTWLVIRSIMHTYRDRFLLPYMSHDAPYEAARREQKDEILTWRSRLMGVKVVRGVGVDQALYSACMNRGIGRYFRRVPGMKNVGVVGLHTNQKSYDASGLGRCYIYDHPSDVVLRSIRRGTIERT